MLFLKASQSLPLTAAKKMKIIFCRGVYLAENTSQAASVEFVPGGDKLCAQQTAKIVQNPRFWDRERRPRRLCFC